MATEQVNIRLEKQTLLEINQIAKRKQITRTDIIRRAVDEHLSSVSLSDEITALRAQFVTVFKLVNDDIQKNFAHLRDEAALNAGDLIRLKFFIVEVAKRAGLPDIEQRWDAENARLSAKAEKPQTQGSTQ